MNCYEIDRVEPSLASWSRTARPLTLATSARRPPATMGDAGNVDDALFGGVSTAIGIALLVAAIAL